MLIIQVGVGSFLLGVGLGGFGVGWRFADPARLANAKALLNCIGLAIGVGAVMLLTAIPH